MPRTMLFFHSLNLIELVLAENRFLKPHKLFCSRAAVEAGKSHNKCNFSSVFTFFSQFLNFHDNIYHDMAWLTYQIINFKFYTLLSLRDFSTLNNFQVHATGGH